MVLKLKSKKDKLSDKPVIKEKGKYEGLNQSQIDHLKRMEESEK